MACQIRPTKPINVVRDIRSSTILNSGDNLQFYKNNNVIKYDNIIFLWSMNCTSHKQWFLKFLSWISCSFYLIIYEMC